MKKMWLKKNENGSAIVVALLILTLLTAFVALAVTRTTNEVVATSNDAAETRTFAAAQGSLEVMTRNFQKIFDIKLSPYPADLQNVRDLKPPDFDGFTFEQNITQTDGTKTEVIAGGLYQGLNAQRDRWALNTLVEEKNTGVKVALRREFINNRIPIFQFGIFYDDDLEFHPGPRFDFGGRVHSNDNLFLMASTGVYFSSRVSAAGQIFTDVARNGSPYTDWSDKVYIKNAAGTYVQLRNNMGSVQKAAGTPVNFPNADSPMPTVYKNPNWAANKALFQGNLLSDVDELNLPLKIASTIEGNTLDYVELIKRSKNVGDLYNDGAGSIPIPVTADKADSIITAKERYANKRGLRVSLGDSKSRLPGCASGTGTNPVATPCGVRLDGASTAPTGTNPWGGNDPDGSRGYQPKTMADGYQATRINGERFSTGNQVWIKIELVGINSSTGAIETQDVTEDILSLGVTEQATFPISGYTVQDSRSVIKLQRFAIPGVAVAATDTNFMTFEDVYGTNQNIVLKDERNGSGSWNTRDNGFGDHQAHYKTIPAPGTGANPNRQRRIVPFPIEMFDTREGLYNDDLSSSNLNTFYPGGRIPHAGVMSLIDIDVDNLRKFLAGQYNAMMPVSGTPFSTAKGRGLRHTDVPDANGWVLYVSDRRGDNDFDGEYDMEDIYGPNDGIKQPGEDINKRNGLEADYFYEAAKYTGPGSSEIAAKLASEDHKYFRRGVRLINGRTLPGIYDKDEPLNTRGFTVATENGIYVKGNYNATGIVGGGGLTPADGYLPQNQPDHIPASVVADAVTILSNAWEDSRSFRYPFDLSNRDASETTIRFAMLAGDTKSSLSASPNQGGGNPRMAGGVHNFKRFLENWDNSVKLNYAGSLINLYNSRNNSAPFKCCVKTYAPPVRNWIFDTSFLDPSRLPPGTPYFQEIQITGFQRIN